MLLCRVEHLPESCIDAFSVGVELERFCVSGGFRHYRQCDFTASSAAPVDKDMCLGLSVTRGIVKDRTSTMRNLDKIRLRSIMEIPSIWSKPNMHLV